MLSQCPARNEVQRRRFSGSGAVAAVRRRRRQLADPGSKYLRAPDIETGRIAGRFRRLRPTEANCSGVLSAGGGPGFSGGGAGGPPPPRGRARGGPFLFFFFFFFFPPGGFWVVPPRVAAWGSVSPSPARGAAV